MKFSKAQIIIKYNIEDTSSSIYAHIFEHIFVSLIEHDDWLMKKGVMVFGATNFDYIDIQFELLKTSRKLIYEYVKSKFDNLKNLKEYFDLEKKILLRESMLYESADDEKLLLTMLNRSLKIPTLTVQGRYEDIKQISYDKFLKFIHSNIRRNQIIIRIDGKDFMQEHFKQDCNSKFKISCCNLKKTDEFCTIEIIIPDTTRGKDKVKMEILEYLNFSENNGLYKILRNEHGLIYSIEHAYVFIQGLYMLIVEIKCESEVFVMVLEEINKYLQTKLFCNYEFSKVLNYIRVLKHNEYLGSEKHTHNLYHKLIHNKEVTLKSELKELTRITEDEFKNFLENQSVYLGVTC